MGRGAARFLLAWVAYSSLLVWQTWPLAAKIATHRPVLAEGSGYDALYSGWVQAWQAHALVTPGVQRVEANIYYPDENSLYYGPIGLGTLPFFAPVYLLSGNPTLALNFILLGCIALSAAMVHWVVHRWTGWHSAALVAAVAFAANRWLLVTFVPRTPHIASLFWLPVLIFAAWRARERARDALVVCLLAVAQGLTDPLYLAPATLAPLALLSVLLLLRRATRRRGVWTLAAVVGAAVALALIYTPYRDVAGTDPRFYEQTLWRGAPERVTARLPGDLMAGVSPLAIASLVPCLIAGVGLLVLFRSWRGDRGQASAAKHALLWSAVGIAISLPAKVAWGEHVVRLPHLSLLLDWAVARRLLLHPERLRVAALAGVALLAGLAAAELIRQLRWDGGGGAAAARRGALAALLAAAFYCQFTTGFGQPSAYGGTYWSRLQETRAPADSPVLELLRRDGGPTLEVPALPRQGPHPQTAAMYRSIFHWQPLLNGYASFYPADFPRRMTAAARLPGAAAVRELARDTGLAWILVTKRGDATSNKAPARQRRAWFELAARGGRPDLQLAGEDDELLVFRVKSSPHTVE